MMIGVEYYLFFIFIINEVAHARNIWIFHHVKFSVAISHHMFNSDCVGSGDQGIPTEGGLDINLKSRF